MTARTHSKRQSFGIGEWYGRSFVGLTRDERLALAAAQSQPKRDRPVLPCPFQGTTERQVACAKAGGVCSLRLYSQSPDGEVQPVRGEQGRLRTVCPRRFEEDGIIYRWVGRELLGCDSPLVVHEVGFLGAVSAQQEGGVDPDSAREVSRIDRVLVVPDTDSLTWCALEVQAVYFQGRAMRADFAAIRQHARATLPFPRGRRQPDYRSSGPKRLMPQLQIKVPSLRRWGRKMAVVVDEDFFASLAPMQTISDVSNCDIAWFVMRYDEGAKSARLAPGLLHLTTLEQAVEGITAGVPVSLHTFEERIRQKLAQLGAESL